MAADKKNKKTAHLTHNLGFIVFTLKGLAFRSVILKSKTSL